MRQHFRSTLSRIALSASTTGTFSLFKMMSMRTCSFFTSGATQENRSPANLLCTSAFFTAVSRALIGRSIVLVDHDCKRIKPVTRFIALNSVYQLIFQHFRFSRHTTLGVQNRFQSTRDGWGAAVKKHLQQMH